MLRLYELALEIAPGRINESRKSIKREALWSFLRGLVSFSRERILAKSVKSLRKAVNTMLYLLDRDALYRIFPSKPIKSYRSNNINRIDNFWSNETLHDTSLNQSNFRNYFLIIFLIDSHESHLETILKLVKLQLLYAGDFFKASLLHHF